MCSVCLVPYNPLCTVIYYIFIIIVQYPVIHTNSTVADRSFTKKLHDTRYTDLFDTMNSQSKVKKTKIIIIKNIKNNNKIKVALESVSRSRAFFSFRISVVIYCTSLLTSKGLSEPFLPPLQTCAGLVLCVAGGDRGGGGESAAGTRPL